jgi:hypothetical protein
VSQSAPLGNNLRSYFAAGRKMLFEADFTHHQNRDGPMWVSGNQEQTTAKNAFAKPLPLSCGKSIEHVARAAP